MPIGAAVMTVAAVIAVADPRTIAVAGIHAYRRTLAPVAARVGLQCRFTPTCSHYAEAVIEREGLGRGGWKAIRRIARCGPWTARGRVDEP